MTFTDTRALITGADSGHRAGDRGPARPRRCRRGDHLSHRRGGHPRDRRPGRGRRAAGTGAPARCRRSGRRQRPPSTGSAASSAPSISWWPMPGQAMSGVPVAEMDDAVLERILRVNLMGPLFCARPFIKMRKAQGGEGKIVFVSSVAQHLPTPESAPYGMSKAGLGSLCRSLSRELAEDRINVNNVAPGLIETPMTRRPLRESGGPRTVAGTHPVAPRRPAGGDRPGDPLPGLGRGRLRHRPYPGGRWRPDDAMGRGLNDERRRTGVRCRWSHGRWLRSRTASPGAPGIRRGRRRRSRLP